MGSMKYFSLEVFGNFRIFVFEELKIIQFPSGNYNYLINLFQPSVAFHIETSHLFCFAKHITGFYMERNTGMNKLIT